MILSEDSVYSPIAVDATYCLDENPSGVALYSQEILKGLTAAHPEQRFHFYLRLHRVRQSLGTRFPPNASRRVLVDRYGLRKEGLFHGLNQRLPVRRFKRQVVTFHDLFVLTGEYSSTEFRNRFAAQARLAALSADMIIAVSEFTASQVDSLLNVERSRIRVIHHGVHFPALTGFDQASQTPRENVILTVGAIQRRKNTARLVEAFESMPDDWRLVIAGSEGYGSHETLDRIDHSRAKSRISVTGYLAEPDLDSWYRRASIFAFASLDEGFGMPVLEAMARGIPVITSNRAALPEVAGDAAILVDPLNREELADALLRLIREPALRENLARRGLERVRGFTWGEAVEKTWKIYRELLKNEI